MTPQVRDFVARHAGKLNGRVLEVGSLDVNGSLRGIVDIAVGVDLRPGIGVDLVCSVSDIPNHFPLGSFDACISTETLEHVEDWRSFVSVTWDMVKHEGWLLVTMASMQKKRHAYPDDYWRMTNDQIRQIYPGAEVVNLGKKPEKIVSIGWIVQKRGDLGSLDFEPYRVP